MWKYYLVKHGGEFDKIYVYQIIAETENVAS